MASSAVFRASMLFRSARSTDAFLPAAFLSTATCRGVKLLFIINWVQDAIARSVPIDCVGNQFHNTINFPIDDLGSANSKQNVIATLNQFASLTSTAGVPIINEVTEFDISMYRFGNCSQTFYSDYDDLTAGDTVDLINEGYRYRDYFQIFKSLKNEIDSVTIWGLGDDDSWLNPHSSAAGCPGVTVADAPLPFDSGLQHKFAYTALWTRSHCPVRTWSQPLPLVRGQSVVGNSKPLWPRSITRARTMQLT